MYNETAAIEADSDIKEFVRACDRLAEGKYILSERRLADLMKTIAGSEKLYGIFRDALKGYNRKAEFHKSQTTVGSRSKLILPQNQTKLLAYVFCLLVELDSGERSLRDFLDEYFYHTNPNEEYALFCAALIVPFRDVTEYVYYNGAESYLEDDGVDFTLRDSAKAMLAQMTTLVSESTLITAQTKQELFLLARAIETSLTPNRIDLVKALLIGYKNTVNACSIREKMTPLLDSLYRLFTVNDII